MWPFALAFQQERRRELLIQWRREQDIADLMRWLDQVQQLDAWKKTEAVW